METGPAIGQERRFGPNVLEPFVKNLPRKTSTLDRTRDQPDAATRFPASKTENRLGEHIALYFV